MSSVKWTLGTAYSKYLLLFQNLVSSVFLFSVAICGGLRENCPVTAGV